MFMFFCFVFVLYVLNNRDFLDGLLDVVNLRVWFVETDQEFKDPSKMAFCFSFFILETSHVSLTTSLL